MKIREKPSTRHLAIGEVEFRLISYQLCPTCNVPNNTPGSNPDPQGDYVNCLDCDEGVLREEVAFDIAIAQTPIFQKMLEAIANCATTDAGILKILTKAGLMSPDAQA